MNRISNDGIFSWPTLFLFLTFATVHVFVFCRNLSSKFLLYHSKAHKLIITKPLSINNSSCNWLYVGLAVAHHSLCRLAFCLRTGNCCDLDALYRFLLRTIRQVSTLSVVARNRQPSAVLPDIWPNSNPRRPPPFVFMSNRVVYVTTVSGKFSS